MTPSKQKIFYTVAVIAMLFVVMGFLLPWWMMPAVALIYGALMGARENSAWRFFREVFIGVFAAWALVALFFDARTSFHLSSRIGGMFKMGFPTGGVLVTALIGALLASLFALAGASLRIGAIRVINNRP